LEELEALGILASTPYLGSIRIRLLIAKFGSALTALNAHVNELAELPGFGPRILQSWGHWQKDLTWKTNIALADREGVSIIPYTSPQFPKRLLELPDHPILLYVKGELKITDQHSIAIVGTRQASIYGMEIAERIAKDLAAEGFTIVSGLARGIDTAAHRGALAKGRTIAVIGSGLSDVYPQENIGLSQTIAKQGALISEFPMATPPDRQNFPQRNRIVSGMTLGTLLIEAPLRSGAMLTMERALAQGKKLFVIPGRVDSDNFRGNHSLLKNGQAKLVENADDIIKEFNNLFSRDFSTQPIKRESVKIELDCEEQQLVNLLPQQELTFDEILKISKVPVMKLNVLLMSLIMKRVIKEFPGKSYKKVING